MFKKIKKLSRRGYRCIAGVDEGGRGPLAGPVLACAVVFNFGRSDFLRKSDIRILKGIRDSKKLSAKQREKWYRILTNYPDLQWAVASASHKMIDKINVREATKLAMRRAVEKLQKKLDEPVDFLIIDGSFILASGSRESSSRPGCERMEQI